MTAQELLDTLTANGFTLRSDGATVWIAPMDAVTPAVAQAIRAVRPQLLALLESRRASEARAVTFRLTQLERRTSRRAPWTDAALARYSTRLMNLVRLGFHTTHADDLAERLHVRDVNHDDRAMCVECAHLGGDRTSAWRCRNPAKAGGTLPDQLVTRLRYCEGMAAKEIAQ